MSDSSPHPRRSDRVESAAAAWLVRFDRGFTAQQQDEFLQWLAASPAHRESFERHRLMWADFNALAHWRPEHSAAPNPDLLARPKAPRPATALRPLLLAAAGIAVVLGGWTLTRRPADEPLAFEAVQYRQETLPDGTILHLNRGTHLVVQFSPTERRVVLVEGEAQFAVAKHPARPFVVRAGGVDVRAIGTAFNVKLAGPNLEVLVTEGTVHVAKAVSLRAPTPDVSAPPAPSDVILAAISAGQRTVFPVASVTAPPVVLPASAQEIARLLAWQPRLLDFDSTPLAEVVAAFNQRNATRLVLADDALQALPIVASIRSDNVAGFVRLLEATMGVRAEHRSQHEILLHRVR